MTVEPLPLPSMVSIPPWQQAAYRRVADRDMPEAIPHELWTGPTEASATQLVAPLTGWPRVFPGL